MKIQPTITAAFLAATVFPCMAQQSQNPFEKQKATPVPAESPAGGGFVAVSETILLPADLLDGWLRDHPPKQDATELRATVQGWISEGKAKLDFTSYSLGCEGKPCENSSILEYMYPTEFAANGSGVWPMPCAFSTRNLGYTVEAGAATTDGKRHLWAIAECGQILGSNSWHNLVERTRQPDDSFIPIIGMFKTKQSGPNDWHGNDPFAVPSPPTAKNLAEPEKPRGVFFAPDLVQLAMRNDAIQEPKMNTRLVFFRGAMLPPVPAEKRASAADISQLTFRVVRVPSVLFSDWLQSLPAASLATDAWSALRKWEDDGKVELISEISTLHRQGVTHTLGSEEEFTYPTEWQSVDDVKEAQKRDQSPAKDGKSDTAAMQGTKVSAAEGLEGASLPTSFDTRNLGISVETSLRDDKEGLLMHLHWNRVEHPGNSVSRRIKVDGEWVPDVVMPLFASKSLLTDLRIQRGEWTLAGQCTEHDATGKPDPTRSVLLFVKAE